MAEKPTPTDEGREPTARTVEAKPPRPREIKDAGQRAVFAAIRLDSQMVVELLRASMELPPLPGAKSPTAKEKEAELKRILRLLDVEDGGGVSAWVRVGDVIDGGPTKSEAVEAAVDKVLERKVPGRFRAPTLTHWRGEVRRAAPTAVPLDEEVVD